MLAFAWYVIHALKRQLAYAEQLASSRRQFDTLAYYDPLTNLPNRRLMADRLAYAVEKAKRDGMVGAILFIDLDEFKIVNDSQGHKSGDLVLQEVAGRLAVCVGGRDTVAHIGGDEFIVILDELATKRADAASRAEIIGELILAALSSPLTIEGNHLRLTASIGIAILDQQALPSDQLLAQADIAMVQAKQSGRNCIRFFDPTMQDEITRRVQLDHALSSALAHHEFRLYYQMQVDVLGRITGAEALIRWIRPDQGIIGPNEFIPRAEETGLIQQIGQWVLDEACHQLKRWESNPATRDLILSINVSALQFRQPKFVDQVIVAIERYGINPERLEFELTEGVMVGDVESTAGLMNALHSIGIKLSLDDFGTGYSSLQYVKKLPIDQLKIDRSFVTDLGIDPDDDAIVDAIIAIGLSMHLEVVAEGVETEQQRDLLTQKGCTHYQGYLFSKPIPIEEFEARLSQR